VSHGDSTEARPGAPSAEARNAGRGIVSIAGAKLWFIVTGYAVQLVLPRLLGSPEAFGFYSTAMTDVSIVNNVLIAATVQTVSKKVSEDESRAGLALRQGLLLQAMWGGALGLALFLLAPFIAGTVKLNPTQAPLYRTAAVVVIAYALYAAIVGALNGRQRFAVQARLDMTFSTLRSGLILGAAALGFGALGAFAGFASAAALIFVVAFVVSRRGPALAVGHVVRVHGAALALSGLPQRDPAGRRLDPLAHRDRGEPRGGHRGRGSRARRRSARRLLPRRADLRVRALSAHPLGHLRRVPARREGHERRRSRGRTRHDPPRAALLAARAARLRRADGGRGRGRHPPRLHG
jgi:PAS domain-containing protein